MMMRLPLAAVFGALAAALPITPQCEPACAEGEFCRVAVAASGAACDTKLPKTCAKLAVRGQQCGGAGGEAQDCFRNQCKSPLKCRANNVDADLPGTCAKQCDIGGGEMVFEGWTGPVAGEGKWCHIRYCDGTEDKEAGGVLKTNGDATAPCPTDLTDGLRCCVGAGKPNQVCCGANGAWLTPDGTVTCARVLAKAGSKAAPFSKTCTDACPATTKPAPGTPAHDDGWKGPDARDGKWCNTCVCTKGALACPDRECPKLKCCPAAAKKTGQVCCGVTGEWVTKDAKDNVVCGGVTMPYKADLATQPFHAACAGLRGCSLFSNVAVTKANGEKVFNPTKGQGCNECTCKDGTLDCPTAKCEAPKCCDAEMKPKTGEHVCCGLDGLWKKVDGAAKCGSYATQVEAKPAVGYPFFKACEPHCAANTAAGGPDKKVPLGWTGPKMKAVTPARDAAVTADVPWCDTCMCAVAAGAPAGTAPVVTCTTHAACPAVKCCPGPSPGADYACCGTTRRWVKAVDGKVKCGGHELAKDSTKLPLKAICTDKCTLDGGAVLSDGQSGPDAGAHWCKRCRCEGTTAKCTGGACARRCCAAEVPTLPAGAVWRCCGANGAWVMKGADDKYRCGSALVADSAEQLYPGTGTDAEKGVCPTVDPASTKCTLHNAAATKVDQGWRGSGLGDNWCHTCKCTAADAGKKVSCPAGTCPAVEKLLCCAKEKVVPAHVCCGLTGEWVAADAKCGPVDLALAGTAAAPVSAACATCTAGTATVPVGWFGSVPGAEWCNKCRCVRDGTLKCTTKTCPPAKCCAATKVGTVACCGTTGEWVAAAGGKYTCAHLTVEEADKGKAPFADACADTCDHDGTPVAVGWAGKKGDGCNYCKCVTAGNLLCSTRVCPGPPLCGTFNCAGAGKQMGVTTKPCVGACNAATCCAATCTEYVAHFPCTAPETLNAAAAGTACPTCNAATCCAMPAGPPGGGPHPMGCLVFVCTGPNFVMRPGGVCAGPGPCTEAECCLPTCAPYTCTTGMKKAALPANCAATPCTDGDCCDPPIPMGCLAHPCAAPNLVKRRGGVCAGPGPCTDAECCLPTCTPYTCTAGTKKAALPANCPATPCTDGDCCDPPGGGGGPGPGGPGMCAGHPCAAPNLVTNPAGACTMVPCSDADCCLPTCVPHVCKAGAKKDPLPANCPDTPCTDRNCCD